MKWFKYVTSKSVSDSKVPNLTPPTNYSSKLEKERKPDATNLLLSGYLKKKIYIQQWGGQVSFYPWMITYLLN